MTNSTSLVEHIRSRPGMYCGGLSDRGLRHILFDLIDEQIDSNNHVQAIHLTIETDRMVRLQFLCAGQNEKTNWCPVDLDPIQSSPWWFKMSMTIAAALCERFDIEAVQHSCCNSQSFSRGVPIEPPVVDPCDESDSLTLSLRIDSMLFPADAHLGFLPLCGRMQELAIFYPQTRFVIQDLRDQIRRDYHYPKGLMSYLGELDHDWSDKSASRTSSGWNQGLYHLQLSQGTDSAEAIIFRSPGGRDSRFVSFVNRRSTKGHGTHVDGLKRGYADVRKMLDPKWELDLEWHTDALDGATVLLSVILNDPGYWGSTKDRLGETRAEELVHRMVIAQLPGQMRKD